MARAKEILKLPTDSNGQPRMKITDGMEEHQTEVIASAKAQRQEHAQSLGEKYGAANQI